MVSEYTEIEFVVFRGDELCNTHQIDFCDLTEYLISKLKEDYAWMFGIPANKQEWFFEDSLLNEQDTLWNAGIRKRYAPQRIIVVGPKRTVHVQ